MRDAYANPAPVDEKDRQADEDSTGQGNVRFKTSLGLDVLQIMTLSRTKREVHAEDLYAPSWNLGVTYNRYGIAYFDGISLFHDYQGARFSYLLDEDNDTAIWGGYLHLQESDLYEESHLVLVGGRKKWGNHALNASLLANEDTVGPMVGYGYNFFGP